MPYKPPVAIYDACVLYPIHLRNLLVQCAVDRLVEARWSDGIHDEWIGNLAANDPSVSIDRLNVTRHLMNAVLPHATVSDYEHHIPAINLPDDDDRHVVAAAIVAGASLIITWNQRDFPANELARHQLRKQTPDAFLMNLYAAVPDVVVAATANARQNLRKSKISAAEFLKALERQKLRKFAAAMNAHRRDL
jgi:predicted nucleic acid-binding protein